MNALETSPDEFRALADRVTQVAADYLKALPSRTIFPTTSGSETERIFRLAPPERGAGAQALDDLAQVLGHCRAQNGGFFGYVLG
ncbi:MAG TPA: hypothetical protein VKB77_12995, partial [Terriglobales bacterium]|nr:hypothetical protein [Terriglobales bacterium]